MAEKLPETNIPGPESPPEEKDKSGVSHATDERAQESAETGNVAAQQGSELSGTKNSHESAVETSEDPRPEPVESDEPVQDTKKQQKPESSKKQETIDDSKLENVSKSPAKASRTKSRKKSTAEEETGVSKGSEQKTVSKGSPSKTLTSKGTTTPKKTEEVTPPKSKSPSILMRLRSHSKLRTTRSSSLPPNDGSSKADDSKGKAKADKSSEIFSPAKRRGLFRKAKSVSRERSNSTSQSESMDISEVDPNLKEIDEKGSKTKPKASVKPKLRASKREEAEEKTTKVEEPEHSNIQSPGTACEQVSTGIESIQLSKKEKDVPSLLCLEESIDSTSSGASGKEESGITEASNVEEIGAVGGAEPWQPQHSHQEGGFQKDVIWAQFSSSAEDTGTEESVVSVSSALKESEMRKVTSTDTLAEIPGLKEEEASGGQELEEKPVPQGQKRVKGKDSSGSDEDSKVLGAVSGSPVKKMAPEKKSADDGSEE